MCSPAEASYLGGGCLFPLGCRLVPLQLFLIVFVLDGVRLLALAAAVGGVPPLLRFRQTLLLDGLCVRKEARGLFSLPQN